MSIHIVVVVAAVVVVAVDDDDSKDSVCRLPRWQSYASEQASTSSWPPRR